MPPRPQPLPRPPRTLLSDDGTNTGLTARFEEEIAKERAAASKKNQGETAPDKLRRAQA